MAISPNNNPFKALGNLNAFREFAGSMFDAVKPSTPAATAAPSSDPKLSPEAQRLNDFKNEAIAIAKAAATKRGEAKWTMSDYFIAANQLGEKHAEEIANNADKGMAWNPKVFSDLSGLKLDNAQINKSELEPSREAQRYAYLQAAIAKGGKPSFEETVRQLQTIQRSGQKIPSDEKMQNELQQAGIDGLRNLQDLDGDGVCSDFYAAIDRHAKFENTVFANCDFHPAGTLMRHGENGVALTENASFKDCTFNGMGPEDAVTFSGKEFENVHFTNIKGGKIIIPDGTQIDGMDIRGATAELAIGRASINNLDATGARIVHLDAAAGTVISHSSFDGATIDMTSQLNGVEFNNVSFKGANLVEVNLSGAKLNHIALDDTNIKQLDLRGAEINSMTVNGKLADRQMLASMGALVDETTAIAIDPKMKQQELAAEQGQRLAARAEYPATAQAPATAANSIADIGAALLNAMNSVTAQEPAGIRTPTMETVAKTQQQVAEIMAAIPISGGQTVTLAQATDIGNNRAVAELERPAAPAQGKEDGWSRGLSSKA